MAELADGNQWLKEVCEVCNEMFELADCHLAACIAFCVLSLKILRSASSAACFSR